MQATFVILVMIDIVDSTRFTERVGDRRASEVMRVYDRIFRGLLIKYEGLEIDKTDGALLLFETMHDALRYVREYHDMVERHIGLRSRAGIHCGYIYMHSNCPTFVARGAKLIEVDGLQKAVTARIMSLAGGGQTFLSRRAGEYASSVRGKLLMRDLGFWLLKGVEQPMQLYAIGDDVNRLALPRENDKVKLYRRPKLTPKERFRLRVRRYVVYPIILVNLYMWLCALAILEWIGYLPTGHLLRNTIYFLRCLTLPLYRDFWTWLFAFIL